MNVVGTIERRLLVTYRAEPSAIEPLLPPGLRLHLVDGHAMVGVCLIRLGGLRPAGAPFGLRCESAAHRIAVEGGVFIPRRDTDALVNTLVGGRLYPGVHHRARFDVAESDQRLHVAFQSVDGEVGASVDVRVSDHFESDCFDSLDAAGDFYRCSPVGWSPRRRGGLEALTLETADWQVQPVEVEAAWSSYFPADAVELDHALLMRDIDVTWRRTRGRHQPMPAALSA